MMKKLLFAIIIIFALGESVSATEFFFGSSQEQFRVGDEFRVNLLMTSSEQVNALEGVITFSKEKLALKNILDGGTIVSLWVERPQLCDNRIIFSGIIPGGFKIEEGNIVSLIFEAIQPGPAILELQEENALLHDGKGTPVATLVSPLVVNITAEGMDGEKRDRVMFELSDLDLPELFQPEIAHDLDVFGGQWFLVFTTHDKGSGLAYYEVAESRLVEQADRLSLDEWVEAESPYALKDQGLKSHIFIKAVDKAGNERIVQLAPNYPVRWYEIYPFWIIIIIILMSILFAWLLWRKKRE